MTVYK